MLGCLFAGCATAATTPSVMTAPSNVNAELARELGRELAASCPRSAPDDAGARRRCADRLLRLDALHGRFAPFVLWGMQPAPHDYDLEATVTTRFDPLVLRRLYWSTFMFEGGARLEQAGSRTVIRVPVRFRHALDPGDYPYPFWHSEKKWRSYQQTQALLFVLQAGRVVAVLRSAEQDASRAISHHACDRCVEWKADGAGPPHVELYRFVLSANNPHVQAVDQAYRAFEQAQRRAQCMACHSPANPAHMNPLELFSYPNQALGARHTIVRVLEHNHMPPAREGQPAGIRDEAYRLELLHLAREFAALGDRAFEFELAGHLSK